MKPIIPLLKYDAALAAIDWLCRVFGFSVRLLVPGAANQVMHAQLQRGDSLIMVSSVRPGEDGLCSPRSLTGTSQVVYVVEPELETFHERVMSTDAEILGPLERDEDGIGRFQVRDIEGHIWSFSDYDPLAHAPQPVGSTGATP